MIYQYLMDHSRYKDSLERIAVYLQSLELSRDVILIKVNWSTDKPGYITDYDELQFLIKGLKKAYPGVKLISMEAYCYERNDPDLLKFPEKEAERRDIIRNNEKLFWEQHRFNELFEAENITHINVSEEYWAGRVADRVQVDRAVREKYAYRIVHPELTEQIPEALYQYSGKSLISFTKIKGIILPGFVFFTLSMKNLFGLIPKTCRRNYHGKPKLNNTIIDMNVIYRSLFDVVGITEALYKTLFISDQHYVIENSGCMLASRDLVTLDAAIIHSLSFNPNDRHFVKMSEPVFNPVDHTQLDLDIITHRLYPLVNAKIPIEEIKKSKEKTEYII